MAPQPVSRPIICSERHGLMCEPGRDDTKRFGRLAVLRQNNLTKGKHECGTLQSVSEVCSELMIAKVTCIVLD